MGLNRLHADKNVLSRQEFSFSPEFSSNLQRDSRVELYLAVGKGEKAKGRTSKGFLDIKWLFHNNFVMS